MALDVRAFVNATWLEGPSSGGLLHLESESSVLSVENPPGLGTVPAELREAGQVPSYRRFVSLGPVSEGEAQRELRHVLADVERGTWVDERAVVPPAELERTLTFHELAEQWWIRHEPELRPSTQVDYRTRLERHLLPFFAAYRIAQTTHDLVERYISTKLAETTPRLKPRTINMTLRGEEPSRS